MSYSIIDNIKNRIIIYRQKRFRLRRIFLRLRKMDEFKYWSDLVLANSITIALQELNLPYSKYEAREIFKLVDKEDYFSGIKKLLISNLTNSGPDQSVF